MSRLESRHVSLVACDDALYSRIGCKTREPPRLSPGFPGFLSKP